MRYTPEHNARSGGAGVEEKVSVGFLGLGRMGEPMALNLVRAGVPLLVWNRSEPALARLREAGAVPASTARQVLRTCETVILMLANDQAIDLVLERGAPAFGENVSARTIVHMGTTSPDYSARLGAEITRAGGAYVEAPVSGSRTPAEEGSLVGMLAGEASSIEKVRALIRPMCREIFICGPAPNALRMKLAVNLFLITMVTGLVEASHLAANLGLDAGLFQAVLDSGPMASAVSRVKLDKIVRGDLAAQAALSDVLMNNRLVAETARQAAVATPLLDQCHQLFSEADAMGLGLRDMIGVVGALEARTGGLRTTPPQD